MRNRLELHLNLLDKLLTEMSPADLRQIMLDYSELEQTGASEDTLLRRTAVRCFQHLHKRESGFDGHYLSLVGNAAHKVANIRALDEAEDLEASDRAWELRQIAKELVEMGSTDELSLASLCALQIRARTALGMDEPSDDPATPGL